MDCIQLSLFGKTYPEPFPATTETTSGQFWKNLPAWSNQTLLFLDLRGGGRWSKAGAIAGNGWSLAWRQLDSQYFGVAQRRKRIALILDLGGQRAGEILFERTSLSRHPDPCIQAWKEVAGLTANRPAGNDRMVGAGFLCGSSRNANSRGTEADRAGKSEAEERTSGDKCCEAAAYTLKIRSGCAGGGKGALVQTEKTGTISTIQDQTIFQLIQEPTYCISGNTVDRKTNQNGTGVRESGAFTVNTVDRHAVAYALQNQNLCIDDALPFDTTQITSKVNKSNPQWGDPCHPLAAAAHPPAAVIRISDEEMPVQPMVLESNQVHATVTQNGICPTLPASMGLGGGYVPMITDHPADRPVVFENHAQAVAIEYSGCLNPWDTQARRVYGEDGTFPALPSRESAGGNQQAVLAGQRTRWIVRRLTPTECERLQGYPDGWTDIGEWTDTKGKKHKPADSPRYKALGNSIALPQWFWIAQKMKSYMGDGAKLGSLFDGIGGFPLVWETTYGIGTARWASEIEEFPIAVTKKHFPERKEYEN